MYVSCTFLVFTLYYQTVVCNDSQERDGNILNKLVKRQLLTFCVACQSENILFNMTPIFPPCTMNFDSKQSFKPCPSTSSVHSLLLRSVSLSSPNIASSLPFPPQLPLLSTFPASLRLALSNSLRLSWFTVRPLWTVITPTNKTTQLYLVSPFRAQVKRVFIEGTRVENILPPQKHKQTRVCASAEHL